MTELLSVPQLNTMRDGVSEGHRALLEDAGNMLQTAVGIGDLLGRAKESLPRGEFMKWVEDECQVPHRSATGYMRIARKNAEGELSPGFLMSGSIRKALLLEEPKPIKTVVAREPKEVDPIDEEIRVGRQQFSAIQKRIRDLKQEIKDLAGTLAGDFIIVTAVDTALGNAMTAMKSAKPKAKCVYCQPETRETCRNCKKKGWLSEQHYSQAPQKLKELAG